MSVLIKNMKMPSRCAECILCNLRHGTKCKVTGKTYYNGKDYARGGYDGKPDWCPLVEVPVPHGRLIDADVLKNHIENDGHTEAFAVAQIGREGKFFLMGNIIADIDEQPTVIEAERRTDEQ